MKIKHWAGYGCVTAKCTSAIYDSNMNLERMDIKVKGNHERGLVRNDEYDVFNWLIKRFKESKHIDSYRNIKSISCDESYEKDKNGEMIETCIYHIEFHH